MGLTVDGLVGLVEESGPMTSSEWRHEYFGLYNERHAGPLYFAVVVAYAQICISSPEAMTGFQSEKFRGMDVWCARKKRCSPYSKLYLGHCP